MNRKLRRQLARQKRSSPILTLAPCILILAETGGRQQRLGFIDPGGAELQRYLEAPNLIRVVRKNKTGFIVELHISPHGDDQKLPSHGAGQSLTYEESICEHWQLPMLKRYDTDTRRFVKWGENDGFNPMRFNPDLIPKLRS